MKIRIIQCKAGRWCDMDYLRDQGRRFRQTCGMFRILQGFAITVDANITAACNVDMKCLRLILHPWPLGGTPEPQEFMLHEAFHCVLLVHACLNRRYKCNKLAEEELVRDLCVVHKMGRSAYFTGDPKGV